MLSGRVTADNEALLEIEVRGPDGQVARIEVAIDTGYNGFLTLPSQLIEGLDLPFAGTAEAMLGDGREVSMDLAVAIVEWDGETRSALVLESEGGPLLGMAMLAGCRMTMDVEADGSLFIERLASAATLH